MTDTQTLEILDLLKSLPSEKIDEVKDFALFLREKYKKNEVIAEKDEALKKYGDLINKPNFIPPRRNSLKEDGEAVLGIWADREEDALEIARKIRDKNNGKI
jgi:hypothetical protein